MEQLNEAAQLLVAGRLAEAEALCQLIRVQAPEQVGVYYLLALIANAQSRFIEALGHADEAIRCNAGVAEIYLEKARALAGLEDRPQAILAVQTALDMAPGLAGAAELLAQLSTAEGRR